METIVIACPCGRRLRVSGESRGSRVRCPGCQRVLIVPQAATADAGSSSSSQMEVVSTLPIKGRGGSLGPGDVALGLLVVAAACALMLVGAAIGITPALQALESGGETDVDATMTIGIAAMGVASIVFGVGVLARIEMLRRMFLPAGILFAVFSGFVAAMTNLAPMWCGVAVFYAGVTFVLWTAASETYTGGGWPTWAISAPIASVAAIMTIVVGLNQKKDHAATGEAREAQRKFDKELGVLQQDAIACSNDLALAGGAVLDLAPGDLDAGRVPGSAGEQERVTVDARRRAGELLRKVDEKDAEFARLRERAREGWEAGRGLQLRILRVVSVRLSSTDASAASALRVPLKQAIDRARAAQGITDTSRASAEDLRYITQAVAWGEKVLSRIQ